MSFQHQLLIANYQLSILPYLILMLVYIVGWHKRARKSKLANDGVIDDKSISFSIVIPARNEAVNIENCLTSILQNNYPKDLFEIILINDFSEDNTADIANAVFQKFGFENGSVLQLSDFISQEERINSFKKKSLEIAISQAKGEYIITTDADCTVPELWLHYFAEKIKRENALFVIAPVSFIPYDRKSILYYFQSLDFMSMQGITAANAQIGIGSMCNGANLCFRKATFYELGGYSGIHHLASGDDMMLLHKFRKRYNHQIVYLLEREAIVQTPVQESWGSFLQQRIRWASKSGKYRDDIITIQLLVVYLFNLGMLALGLLSVFQQQYFGVFVAAIIAKIVVELLFLIPVAHFYQKKKELLIFPLLQILHIAYIVLAGFLGFFGKYKWKGRVVQ